VGTFEGYNVVLVDILLAVIYDVLSRRSVVRKDGVVWERSGKS